MSKLLKQQWSLRRLHSLPPTMNIVKLETDLNTIPLLEEVLVNPQDWDVDTSREDGTPEQKQTKSIHLIKGVQEQDKAYRDSNLVYPTGLLEKYTMAQNFLSWFKSKYGGRIARVLYVKLPAKKVVFRHYDAGEYYKDKDRFHLVLCGNYNYEVDGDTDTFRQGDLVWFDNKKPHSSSNSKDMERISLIFDVYGSKWREMVNSDSDIN
jgi:quercetin dioxygenase-like cupin family protein